MCPQAKTPFLLRRAAMDWINRHHQTRRRQAMKQRGGVHLAFTRWQTRESGPENWRSAAACRAVDPGLFFSGSPPGKRLEQATEAKRICAGRRVQRGSLSFEIGR